MLINGDKSIAASTCSIANTASGFLYRYVFNDPVNRVDPSGMADETVLKYMDLFGMTEDQAKDAIKQDAAKQTARQAQTRELRLVSANRSFMTNRSFCMTCHGSADGSWVNIASGLDPRPLPPDQLAALNLANATSQALSPYAKGGVMILGAALGAVAAVATAPLSGAAALGLGWFAADDAFTGIQTIVSGDVETRGITNQGIYNWASIAGASDARAESIAGWGELGLRLINAGHAWYASSRAMASVAKPQAIIEENAASAETIPTQTSPAALSSVVSVPQPFKLPTSSRYLTVAEFEALPEQGTISPWRIRSSQNTASWNFKPPFQNSSIGDAAYQLREGQISPGQFGAVKLVEKDGMIWSVDNRRVLAFRSAGMDIPYEKTTWEALTPAQKAHFTSTTNGESITIVMPNR